MFVEIRETSYLIAATDFGSSYIAIFFDPA